MVGAEDLKREAAARAVLIVKSGMRLGLGTGSTISHFLDLLAERLENGEVEGVSGVPTSLTTADRSRELGIPISELHELAPLDLAVDGADEIDPDLNLIKGLGGALLREKMVAAQARHFVVIADESKLVGRLGERAPLPVEVVPFAWQLHLAALTGLGARPVLRVDELQVPLETDNGNYILDCHFDGGIDEPETLDDALRGQPGIVETGLFIGMTSEAFVATATGVRHLHAGADR